MALNKKLNDEFKALAEEHYKHDLRDSDRDALKSAAVTTEVALLGGSLLGLGLGLLLASRLRRARTDIYKAFKAKEQPVAVKYADGREEAFAYFTPLVEPSRVGSVATYGLLGALGIGFGGQIGAAGGLLRAKSTIGRDQESRDRILAALRALRVDALRKEADAIEQGAMGAGGL